MFVGDIISRLGLLWKIEENTAYPDIYERLIGI